MKISHLVFVVIFFIVACKQQQPLTSVVSHKKSKTVYHINAIEDVQSQTIDGFVIPYTDNNRKAMAINAAKFKNQFAAATYQFNGKNMKLRFINELHVELKTVAGL